jgi:hypothetical protein
MKKGSNNMHSSIYLDQPSRLTIVVDQSESTVCPDYYQLLIPLDGFAVVIPCHISGQNMVVDIPALKHFGNIGSVAASIQAIVGGAVIAKSILPIEMLLSDDEQRVGTPEQDEVDDHTESDITDEQNDSIPTEEEDQDSDPVIEPTNKFESYDSIKDQLVAYNTLHHQIIVGESVYRLSGHIDSFAKYDSNDQSAFVQLDQQSGAIVDIIFEGDDSRVDQYTKIKSEYLDRMIGPIVEVTISGIADNNQIEGKVDTGATTCSIDAQDLEIVPDSFEDGREIVVFTFRDVKYRAVVDHYQTVTTADGTSNRPVIIVNVMCNDKLIEEVAFNLSDRSTMDYDVLLGMNFLEQTDFLIDPSKPLHESTLPTVD